MREIYRILDANFNRAREALRVAEDCGRFALNDPAITWTHVPAEPPKESEKEAVILDARFGDNGTPGISVLSTLMNIKQHQVFDFSPLDASQGEQLP